MLGARAVLVAVAIAASGGCKDWDQLSANASRCDELCGLAGGTCLDNGQCAMPCTTEMCRCPDDHACVITATGDMRPTIDCMTAVGCEVRCATEGSCPYAQIACGRGDCRVSCTADFACTEITVSCGTGACDVECTQDGTSGGGTIACGAAASCALECTQQGCTSLKFDCDRAETCHARCTSIGATCADADLDCDASPACVLECNGTEARCAQ
jgi:hypothetical protein